MSVQHRPLWSACQGRDPTTTLIAHIELQVKIGDDGEFVLRHEAAKSTKRRRR